MNQRNEKILQINLRYKFYKQFIFSLLGTREKKFYDCSYNSYKFRSNSHLLYYYIQNMQVCSENEGSWGSFLFVSIRVILGSYSQGGGGGYTLLIRHATLC